MKWAGVLHGHWTGQYRVTKAFETVCKVQTLMVILFQEVLYTQTTALALGPRHKLSATILLECAQF